MSLCHIDVYKRQVLYTERNTAVQSQDINGDSIIEIPITHILPGISSDTISDTDYIVNWHRYDVSTNTFTNLLSTVAVSYTHLDVYKRQQIPFRVWYWALDFCLRFPVPAYKIPFLSSFVILFTSLQHRT